jgi:hypothetical protein
VHTAGDVRRSGLYRGKRELELARRYPARPSTPRFGDWPATLAYLTGFIAAEGSFGISGGQPRVSVNLRADDAPLLHALARVTGWGSVTGPYPAGHVR